MISYLVMGQSYSKEVKSFRKKSKKEANALGFLPNKRAVAHPLNRAPESTKDPRSKRQAETWEAEVNFRLIHRPFFLEDGGMSIVVDIIEARRIGEEALHDPWVNYICVKYETLPKGAAEDQFQVFSESRGWSHERWIDDFRMAVFPLSNLQSSTFRVSIVFGTCDRENLSGWGFHGEEEALYKSPTSSKEIRVNLAYDGGNRLLLKPTWFQWRKRRSFDQDPFVKTSVQVVPTRKMPNLADFLPFPQWPSMILHTKKTRLDLMMEEEAADPEVPFDPGLLGSSLISYNPSTLPRMLGVFSGDYNRDFMLAFGLVMGAPIVDRSGTLAVDHYRFEDDRQTVTERRLKVGNFYPVPPLNPNAFYGKHQREEPHDRAWLNLTDLMLKRSRDILERAASEGKRLQVLWSGGIDTTAVVVAFQVMVARWLLAELLDCMCLALWA